MKELPEKLLKLLNSIQENIKKIFEIYGEFIDDEVYELAFKYFWQRDPNLYQFSFLSKNVYNQLQICPNFYNAIIIFDKKINTIKIKNSRKTSCLIISIPKRSMKSNETRKY